MNWLNSLSFGGFGISGVESLLVCESVMLAETAIRRENRVIPFFRKME
jgi:hypothetical protein